MGETQGDDAAERAAKLLPAWFVRRMMADEWSFALIMSTGDIVHITHIAAVHLSADGIWLDVELAEQQPAPGTVEGRHITAPTSRTTASINARHVVMALEMADT